MNPIQINDLQKARLAAMCLKLFPETPYLYFGKNWDSDRVSIGNYKHGEAYIDSKPQKIHNFHWFEFVMTQVAEKVLNPNPTMPDRVLKEKFNCFFWECNLFWWEGLPTTRAVLNSTHPIDYLYKIFKNEMGTRKTEGSKQKRQNAA